MKDRVVLVTGGAGFIGGHLVDALAGQNTVRVLDTDPVNQSQDRSSVEFIRGDVRTENAVENAVKGVDVVFHQAALVDVAESVDQPKLSHEINATGTLNVLEAARKHDTRVIVASSAAVYGDPRTVPIRETHDLTPTSPYGLTKVAADRYTQLYHDLYGLETVALRYFNVYGPGQSGGDYSGVIDTFLRQARQGTQITVHGDGKQTRDFVHVDDIVQANCLAAETDAVGAAYNVGTGESVTIRRLAEQIRDLVDSDAEIVHTEPRSGDIRQSCADLTRAHSQLEYEPTISLEDGLKTLRSANSVTSG